MPTPLAHTSARVLEFESLRDLLRGYAPSPLGQVKLALLVASSDRDWIETQQGLTTEIREFRRVGGHFEFSGLLDVGQSVEKARIAGAALISLTSCAPFATRFALTERWKTAHLRNWHASAATSKNKSARFRIHCAHICADWPKAERFRRNWSPFGVSASSSR